MHGKVAINEGELIAKIEPSSATSISSKADMGLDITSDYYHSEKEAKTPAAGLPDAARSKLAVGTGSASEVTAEWQRPYRRFVPAAPKPSPLGGYAMAKAKPSGAFVPESRLIVGSKQMRGREAKPEASVDSLSSTGDAEVGGNTEAYDAIEDNAFKRVTDEPLSTFSVDVDTASYANVRRMLRDQQRPPHGAVRIEELVNYFTYDYDQPSGDAPFSVNLEVATCPWQPAHRLLRVGLKGKDMARKDRPAANLVFLVDVSGSMNSPGKLPLVKESLQMLVDQMRDQDRVALTVYAGTSGLVLDSTSDKAEIRRAIANLEAGGSTNGGSGIQLAYRTAREHLVKDGTNRVILCTDGDFNVGTTSQSELVKLIEKERKGGVFLSVLGFGTGNLKDSTMEKLADKGNGNYAYIDGITEAKKVLVDQMVGTLVTIAKDVKLQLEFNPAQVGSYRLIGYENRVLATADFNDDRKDAGEIGAGHTVTALYELVPPGAEKAAVDGLKYQPEDKAKAVVPADLKKELLTVKLRYKEPTGETSKLLEFPLNDSGHKWEQSSVDFRWAASVASFGMILRDSPHRAGANWELVDELAAEAKGEDRKGYRAEFLKLIDKAKVVAPVKH
jgi:Ca-activated chloride channel family protein